MVAHAEARVQAQAEAVAARAGQALVEPVALEAGVPVQLELLARVGVEVHRHAGVFGHPHVGGAQRGGARLEEVVPHRVHVQIEGNLPKLLGERGIGPEVELQRLVGRGLVEQRVAHVAEHVQPVHLPEGLVLAVAQLQRLADVVVAEQDAQVVGVVGIRLDAVAQVPGEVARYFAHAHPVLVAVAVVDFLVGAEGQAPAA